MMFAHRRGVTDMARVGLGNGSGPKAKIAGKTIKEQEKTVAEAHVLARSA
ncbi:hypothetical protein ACRAWG_02875 [Methylobacterium sp. P31]